MAHKSHFLWKYCLFYKLSTFLWFFKKLSQNYISTNILFSLYCNASAMWLLLMVWDHCRSAIVLHNLIALCATLGESTSLFTTSFKNTSASGSSCIYFCSTFADTWALVTNGVFSYLCFWSSRAATTCSLIDVDVCWLSLSNIVSMFSLGTSSTISNLSKSGPEILDWYLLISLILHTQFFSLSL